MKALGRPRAWVIALAVTVTIGVVGGAGQYWLETSTLRNLSTSYGTLLNANRLLVRLWSEQHEDLVSTYGRDPRVALATAELLRTTAEAEADTLRAQLIAAPAQAELRALLDGVILEHEYVGFGLLSPAGLYLAGRYDGLIGESNLVGGEFMERILTGETVLSPPFPLPDAAAHAIPNLEPGQPIMFAAAPVLDNTGVPIAGLGFVIRPFPGLTRILAAATPGDSGETIAFDGQGLALSSGRFGFSAEPFMLNAKRGSEPRLMHLVARAFTGAEDVDLKGHADYRGVNVVGTWAWLPELGLGLLVKQDADEAFGTLRNLQRGLWILVGMLLLASTGLYAVSRKTVRLQDRIRAADELGPYRVEKKIGEGGMGTVYRARHSLLKRPTAIKLLKADRDPAALARFEREVHYTARLSHPNTIAIYDYGHTPDGAFYYAMEYLEGITLDTCVTIDGPQCEARVVHIMTQACGSIAEAHAAGLVHRDIKPTNIMLCERGTLFDFVKIMDFGLVRAVDHGEGHSTTSIKSLAGTPLYLSPEAIRDPDQVDERSDLYQLGAIAYFLVTGRPVFEGNNIYEVCAHHLNSAPLPPSERLGASLSPDLEEVVLRCLEKDKRRRPGNAMTLLEALEACEITGRWGQHEARAWWQGWLNRQSAEEQRAAREQSLSQEMLIEPKRG